MKETKPPHALKRPDQKMGGISRDALMVRLTEESER
jgi:hypothetical protein